MALEERAAALSAKVVPLPFLKHFLAHLALLQFSHLQQATAAQLWEVQPCRAVRHMRTPVPHCLSVRAPSPSRRFARGQHCFICNLFLSIVCRRHFRFPVRSSCFNSLQRLAAAAAAHDALQREALEGGTSPRVAKSKKKSAPSK